MTSEWTVPNLKDTNVWVRRQNTEREFVRLGNFIFIIQNDPSIFYSDQEFEKFLDENFPQWNSDMITPGFEFDQKLLRQVEGPLASEARNLSHDDLQRTGFLEIKNRKGRMIQFSLADWTSAAYSQKGELDAFQMAVRSFCYDTVMIQCNVKKDQFLNLIPKAVGNFEFDLMVALKVD